MASVVFTRNVEVRPTCWAQISTRSASPGASSVSSVPRPIEIRKNRLHCCRVCWLSSSWMAGRSAAVTAVTRVFTCTGSPASAAMSRASRVASNVPGTIRTPSWRGGVRAVEGQRDGLDADLLHPEDLLAGQEGSHRRGQRDADAPSLGLGDEYREVGTAQRVATGHHHVGQCLTRAASPKPVMSSSSAIASRRGELAGRGVRHGGGAAVTTGESAGVGQLPVDDHRRSLVGPAIGFDCADACRVCHLSRPVLWEWSAPARRAG